MGATASPTGKPGILLGAKFQLLFYSGNVGINVGVAALARASFFGDLHGHFPPFFPAFPVVERWPPAPPTRKL